MSNPDFKLIQVSMVDDVALIEILVKDLRVPDEAQALGAELDVVAHQSWAERMILDFERTEYLCSTGFAVMVRLANEAKGAGRQMKICGLSPELRIGADIIGLGRFIDLHDTQRSALHSFSGT